MQQRFSLSDPKDDHFTPRVTKPEFRRALEDHLTLHPYDPSANMRNPYTGARIANMDDYLEYARDHVYLDLCRQQLSAHYSAVHQQDVAAAAALTAQKCNAEFEQQRSELIKQYDSILRKHKRRFSLIVAGCVISLCAVLFFYLPSQRSAAYQSGSDDGYNSGYSAGNDAGYNSGYDDGKDSGYTSGYDAGARDGYSSGKDIGYSAGYSAGRASVSGSQPPSDPSDASDIVYVTSSGTKYHRSGCSYLKSSRPLSRSDAIAAGYGPCSRCKP